MIDFGFTGIWTLPETMNEIREEFKKEINSIPEDDGIHTFFLCNYSDYIVTVECVYLIVIDKRAFFLWSPMRVAIELDAKLTYNDIDSDSGGTIFPSVFYEHEDVEYIGDVCTDRGNMLSLFSLCNNDKSINEMTALYEQELIPLHHLQMATETDYVDMAIQYANYIHQHFKTKITKAIVADSPYEGMDENPFQNEFYDRSPDQ
jgi:hypothetical protein